MVSFGSSFYVYRLHGSSFGGLARFFDFGLANSPRLSQALARTCCAQLLPKLINYKCNTLVGEKVHNFTFPLKGTVFVFFICIVLVLSQVLPRYRNRKSYQ